MRHPRENLRREVQPGGRRGDGAAFASEDRLVALRVRRLDFALEVRRQRHFARRVEIDRAAKVDHALTVRLDCRDDARHAADVNERALAHFAARLDEALPAIAAEVFEEEQFDPSVVAVNARRDDARVVQNHEIAVPQEAGKFREAPMLDPPCRAVQHEHARVFTARERMPGDQFIRQRVVVVGGGEAHEDVQYSVHAARERCIRDYEHFSTLSARACSPRRRRASAHTAARRA